VRAEVVFMRLCLSIFAVMVYASVWQLAAGEPAKKPGRLLDTAGLKSVMPTANKPSPRYADAIAELKQFFPNPADQKKVAAQVEFGTERVVGFLWQGSGGDRVNFQRYDGRKKEATFSYTVGMTDDLVEHAKFFALPAGAKVVFADPSKDDADSAGSPVRPIPTEGLTRPDEAPFRGGAILTAKDLAKIFPNNDEQAKLTKLVNFDSENLLLFAWSGSGGDKLTVGGVDAARKEVVFSKQLGLTRDLRRHFVLFAIPRGYTFVVVNVPRR
jgi:hypothetical protein